MNAYTQYAGKPTRWQYITRFCEFRREGWRVLRPIEREMFREGRLSSLEYLQTYNLELLPEWRWVDEQVEAAMDTDDPIQAARKINLPTLAASVDAITETFELAASYIRKIETLPLAECPGYVFNQLYGITQEEREHILANEADYIADLVPRVTRPLIPVKSLEI